MLGKRDLSSRIPEIKSSVIGKVARVHQNLQFDLKEVELRNHKQLNKNHAQIYPKKYSNVGTVDSKAVACVQETEPAVYYIPEGPKHVDVKRMCQIGRQGFVWTSINGHTIQKPRGMEQINFEDLPFEIRLEFIQRRLRFQGLIGTSWQAGSQASTVTPAKFPVAKAGTAMIHPMYPTNILAGDIVGVTYPSDRDIEQAVATPGRDTHKYVLAYKSMREIEEIHDRAITLVIQSAKRVKARAVAAAAAAVVDRYTGPIAGDTNYALDSYTAAIMNITDEKDALLVSTTTPFQLLWRAMKQTHNNAVICDQLMWEAAAVPAAGVMPQYIQDVSLARLSAGGPFSFHEDSLQIMMDQNREAFKILSTRRQLLEANQVGLALTSGSAGQPIDMLVGRGKCC